MIDAMATFGYLRDRLQQGKPLFGYMVTIPSTRIVRALATVGTDYVIIDTEHHAIGPESVHDLILATSGTSCSPTVRLPGVDEAAAKVALDCGATAVWFPHIDSADQAEEAVRITRYPPLGKRGVGPTFALRRWGLERPEYLRSANDTILVAVLIESIEGVKALSDIVRVPGIDIVSIGRGDLATSLGRMGQENHDEVRRCVAEIQRVVRGAGLALSELARTPAEARQFVAIGYDLVALGSDMGLLTSGAQAAIASALEEEAVVA